MGRRKRHPKRRHRRWREQARTIFLLVVGIGLRRGEVLGLRWRDVGLADPNGAVLRVRETFVLSVAETPKSEAGERTIALGPRLAEELWQHRRRTAFAVARAGHSNYKTTQLYIDLAGQTFREEAELAEQRLLGAVQYKEPVEGAAFVAKKGNGGAADLEAEAPAELGLPIERSGAGVEPTEPWVARPHRF